LVPGSYNYQQYLATPGTSAGTSAPPRPRSPLATHQATDYVQQHDDASNSEPPIDKATLQAYEQGPDESQAPASTKANAAEETAAVLNRQAATQTFLPQPAREEVPPTGQTERAATEEAFAKNDTVPDAPPDHVARVPAPAPVEGGNSSPGDQATLRNPADPLPSSSSSSSAVPDQVSKKPASTSHSSSSNEEKDEKKGFFSRKAKKSAKEKTEGGDHKTNVAPEDNPDLAHFTPEQKRIILAQTQIGNEKRKATYADIYKFSTKFELLLDFLGLLCAIVSGEFIPLPPSTSL
jgi:hypothetical protein